MLIIVYIFAGLFFILAAGLVLGYVQKRHPGLLLMAAAYGSSAGAAIALGEGWPLLAGLAVAWIFRLVGLEPDVKRD